jgi:hypothetical protein
MVENILDEPLLKFFRFCYIGVSYDDEHDLERLRTRYQAENLKLKFRRSLNCEAIIETNTALNTSAQLNSIDQTMPGDQCLPIESDTSSQQIAIDNANLDSIISYRSVMCSLCDTQVNQTFD